MEVVFVNHSHDPTPEGQLLLQVQGIIAEYERAKIQERNRRGKMHAARTGAVSVMSGAPYGYRYIRRDPDGGAARYEVIPEEAEWVRRIFTWVCLEGCSLSEVCRRLDRAGVSTRHRRRGWCISTVAQMLANTAYIGTAMYGGTRMGPRRGDLRRPRRLKKGRTRSPYSIYKTDPSEQVPIPVPAIIDAHLFEGARQSLAANRRRQRVGVVGATVLLQGLLVCTRCGYAYHGCTSQLEKKNPYRYYRCGGSSPSRVGADAVCKNRLLNMKKADEAVWEDVRGILLDPHRLAEEHHRRVSGPAPEDTPRAALWARRVTALRRGVARLIDAYQNGDISKEEFEPRIRGSRERLAQLEGMASAVEDRERCEEGLRLAIGRIEEFSKQVRERLDTCEFAVRRDIIRALVDRIEVDELAVRIVYKVAIGPFDRGPTWGSLQHRTLSVPAVGVDLCVGGHGVDLRSDAFHSSKGFPNTIPAGARKDCTIGVEMGNGSPAKAAEPAESVGRGEPPESSTVFSGAMVAAREHGEPWPERYGWGSPAWVSLRRPSMLTPGVSMHPGRPRGRGPGDCASCRVRQVRDDAPSGPGLRRSLSARFIPRRRGCRREMVLH